MSRVADDDFVQSILADSAPLVGSPGGRRGGGRGRRGGNALADEVVSYGTPSPPPGKANGALLDDDHRAVNGGDLEAPRDDANASGGSPVSRGSFMQSYFREKEAELLAASLAAFSEDEEDPADDTTGRTSTIALFRYALLFVNFTFVVTAILMVMAGVVARFNSALQLCSACGRLTLASIILGGVQWLLALFAFNWIRERNILFLLGYMAVVLLITVCLFGIFAAGIAFSFNLTDTTRTQDFLQRWMQDINTTDPATGESTLCAIELNLNCSGFQYGCCTPDICYPSNNTPAWVSMVCPYCPSLPPTTRMCNDIVATTAQRNLGGFVVITFFSILLAGTGIALAAFSRRITK